MKRKFIMMSVLIPGPKQPGNDIDVYPKPLIEDLLLLWKEEGARMWNAHVEDHFNLPALLFVTTNDWPALSNLSEQSNKGYRVWTHCFEETDSTYLKHCRKIVYMGHCQFLLIKHPLRGGMLTTMERQIIVPSLGTVVGKWCLKWSKI
jgi:hypothetical protein